MGTIASVMQFKCEACGLINPTEKSTCICGTVRSGSTAHHRVDNKEAAFVPTADARSRVDSSISNRKMELAKPGAGLSRSVSQNAGNFDAAGLAEQQQHQIEGSGRRSQQPHTQLKHSVSCSISAGGCHWFSFVSKLPATLMNMNDHLQESGTAQIAHSSTWPALRIASPARVQGSRHRQLVTGKKLNPRSHPTTTSKTAGQPHLPLPQRGPASVAPLRISWISTLVRSAKLPAHPTYPRLFPDGPLSSRFDQETSGTRRISRIDIIRQ